MPKKKGKTNQRPIKVNLPPYLIEIIDEILEEGVLGYRSRDEFVADAVRRRLEELGYIKIKKE